jgi:hypothetical protein
MSAVRRLRLNHWRAQRRIFNTVVTSEVIVKQQHSHSFLLQVLAAATAWFALASYSAAEPGAPPPDVTVAVHATHYAFGGHAFDDPEKLAAVIDAMNPRSIGVDACGPGSTRPLKAAAYRLRARPLYLRALDTDEAACAGHGAIAQTVSLRALRNDDEPAVDRYWRSIAP